MFDLNVLKSKKNMPVTISLLVILVSLFIPYYFVPKSWLSSFQLGGILLITGFGVFLLFATLACAFCLIKGFSLPIPILAIVAIIGFFTYGSEVFKWGIGVKLGAWVLLVGGIMLLVTSLMRVNEDYKIIKGTTVDFSNVAKTFNNGNQQKQPQQTQTKDASDNTNKDDVEFGK